MSYEKEVKLVTKAITQLNVNSLENILNTNNPYINSKNKLFLSKLNVEFDKLKERGIDNFDIVTKGACTT